MKDTKVITELKDIQKIVDLNAIEINALSWRTRSGEEVKMVNMTPKELQKIYDHANDMIYNKNKYTPGKQQVKVNIKTLIARCNAELFLRYLLHELHIDFFKTNLNVMDFVREKKSELSLTNNDFVTTLFDGVPKEYETLTLGLLMDACLDGLEVINRKMIPDHFIISQGIWLTEEEKKELTEYDENGKQRSWMDVIKERLILNPNVKLRVDPKGFSYEEFRQLIHLEVLSKISSLPSSALKLLRDKVFLLLDADCDYHIEKWEKIISDIEKVAQYKGITLTKQNYE